MGKLTDHKVKTTKPGSKAQKLSDGEGLFLFVTTKGQKYWRYGFRFNKKQKTLALGVYPTVTLKEAREKHREARSMVLKGEDPAFTKKLNKALKDGPAKNSFEAVAWNWFDKRVWVDVYRDKQKIRLAKDILPYLGERPINEITAREVLIVCKRVEERGAIETAHKIKQICSQVFRYGLGLGLVDSDPARDLKGALAPVDTKHRAAIIDPKGVGELMRVVAGFTGTHIVKTALLFSIYAFPRPGELRHAEWDEIDFDSGLWRVPPEKMKMKRHHLVPLSRQATKLLKMLQVLTGDGKYVFPSIRTKTKPLSDNTLNAALRRLGYTKEEVTAHGFRATASTLLHEKEWDTNVIEMQLSHVDQNDVRKAYNHAKYLPQRKQMMQEWADYLDELKETPRP